MEGVTGHLFRNAFHEFFGTGVDKYYTPFLTPCPKRAINDKEIAEVLPEHNKNYRLVPQVMTISAEDFNSFKEKLRAFGYEEININLGCPSRTVTSKGKGAGALGDLQKLERFLDGVYSDGDKNISIKTRIGIDYTEEFDRLLEIYNQYPVKELTIHPRLLKELYKGNPHREVFIEALKKAKMPVCYNGDINTVEDYLSLMKLIEDSTDCSISGVMMGRGVLRDPALIRKVSAAANNNTPASEASEKYGAKPEEVMGLLCRLQEVYTESFSGDIPVLYKMKELWGHLGQGLYKGNDKLLKKIMKSRSLSEYEKYFHQIMEIT
ncbi:MAG: tRNA-dihydrouridine synthase family protein [Selenomonadaceae bacterium]|nr:tRNA-dihydrouridine synthase family protein [Selenomonadaceae bacterium]